MDKISTKSTSNISAQCSDIHIRETETTRLVFRPIIVDNPNDKDASVRGTFQFQKKSKSSHWVDFETIPLNSVKIGEGYKLTLDTSELLSFRNGINDLYALHQQNGIQAGNHTFTKENPILKKFVDMQDSEIGTLLNANKSLGKTLLSKLLTWATSFDDPTLLGNRVFELSENSLCRLNAAVGLQRLKKAIQICKSNIDSKSEEFWQKTLTEHSFVLEQVFSWPTSIVEGKAYIGGKSFTNKGGNIVDFLMSSKLTQNAALIEIKTPSTRLLGSVYRNDVHNVSAQLSGSIMQILNYKHSLQENFLSLTRRQGDLFEAINPQCAVIIGNAGTELTSLAQKKSFELYRHQFPGVSIITYDELFEKTEQLIKTLESPSLDADSTSFLSRS